MLALEVCVKAMHNAIHLRLNIENFKDNKVTVVDRWGGLIFQAMGTIIRM